MRRPRTAVSAETLQELGMLSPEIDQWSIHHHRATFAMKYFLDRANNPWTMRDYQRESLESWHPRKVHCDGRDVGKTSEIEIIAAWAATLQSNRQMLIATPCENHLFPLMERLVRRILTTERLADSLVEVKRTPSWFLRFESGFVLWGRIAGPHGINFQGMHVDWQIVDEAQEMTESAWGELHQALNGGGLRWVYGVPNGLRNTFYRMTTDQNAEHYNWPSYLNPEYSSEKDAELALLYGGRQSPGYIHRVLGQHGSPAHAVFDLDAYLACVDEGLESFTLSLGEEDPFEAPINIPAGDYYLGCDLGYARDPSEFVIYRADPPHLINVARINLHGVNYHRQQNVIVELHAAYNFRMIGIDSGNNGRGVSHNLKNINRMWDELVQAFDFGALFEVGKFPNDAPDKRPTKEFMTELIQQRLADRTIIFPHSPDRESQYASHTYSVALRGQILFDKGNDHIIDADRCALLAHHVDTQVIEQPRPLTTRFATFTLKDQRL